ncbi:MAG: hypothetical protein LBT93_02990 [Treponema sp.]|nr:hypothetical protein [Treponema sp.]
MFFLLISCASNPPPVEEAPEPPAPVAPPSTPAPDPNKGPPNQATLDALDAAITELDRIRQQVIDFEGPGYFPKDWDDAESQLRSAEERAKRDTQGDAQESLNRYQGVVDVYGELFRKTLPLYADARKKEIQEARDAAVQEGIQDVSPKHLLLADEKALEALNQYEGGEYYPAAASAALALDMYRLLKTGAAAYHIRQEIVRRDFIPYDPHNFDKADEAGLAAIAAYEAGQTAGLQDKAKDIQSLYALVLKTGWISFATERGAAASAERQAALDAKANVAVRKDFDAAAVLYNQAEGFFKAENYIEAAGLYVQAEYQFADTVKNAIEKRRAAETAIKLAEEKMVESDENARKAELIIEGGAL